MYLRELKLTDFRSYSHASFSFPSSTTCIVGANAAGKTNLLEALFLLSTGKSFRAESDRDMMRFESEIARVHARALTVSPTLPASCDYGDTMTLDVVLTRGHVSGAKTALKRYFVNGVGKRMMHFVGKMRSVLFWPQDLELVTDSPSRRRRYLDFVLVQTDEEYRRSLISYERGIRQRNKVLEAIREGRASRNHLAFWNQLLVKTGSFLTVMREKYIAYLNSSPGWSDVLALSHLHYSIAYDKSVISDERLAMYSSQEEAAGVTLVGPHRDDIHFFLGQENRAQEGATRNVSHFGSRGEQRLAILWLKMGELSYLADATGEKPILLLDDIFSELDEAHRRIVSRLVRDHQTIMTSTEQTFLRDVFLKTAHVISLPVVPSPS